MIFIEEGLSEQKHITDSIWAANISLNSYFDDALLLEQKLLCLFPD